MQGLVLIMIALGTFIAVEMCVNFDGVNSSSVIKNQMPWEYHALFLALCIYLIFTSLFSFVASYYELPFMFAIDGLLSLGAIVGAVFLCVMTGITSSNI